MKQLIEAARNITAGDVLGMVAIVCVMFGTLWAGVILEAITQ